MVTDNRTGRRFSLQDESNALKKPEITEMRWHQFEHLLRQVPMMTAVSIINALILLLVLGGRPPAAPAILWASLIIFPSLYNLLRSIHRRRQRSRSREVTARAMRHSVIWSGYMGAMWGASAPLFLTLNATSSSEVILPIFLIGGMMAGMVASLSPLPRNLAAFGIAAGVPTFAVLLLGDTPVERAMASMFALFCIGLAIAAWNAYHRFREMLEMKRTLLATSDLLADAIESTDEAFALYGPDKRQLLANQQFRHFFPKGAPPDGRPDQTALQLEDGRWVIPSQRPTRGGGRVEVYTDVTALKCQEDALVAARLEAESANRAKSKFLAVMSHELRTPLNSIIGFAELLGNEKLAHSPSTVREYANVIVKSGRHLLELITDILNLSRIEADRYELHEESIDIDAMLEDVSESFAPQLREAGIALDSRPGFGGHLKADRRAIRQILDNLISNALKFTERGGRITLCSDDYEGGCRLIVQDTGIGIAKTAQDLIFEPFRQADERLARAKGGTGLGLPLVRRLAELHGGSATVESQPGHGSRFVVSLPADRVVNVRTSDRATA